MADNKRFYWIKLKDNFMTSDTVDFLMSQKNGANYVVLYQMLCLKTANTNGTLVRTIGEIIIPYDAHKIQRDCKYFDIDTVIVALELYKKLGLVYELDNGYLQISNFENLIGSEVDSAERVRRFRQNQKVLNAPLQCNAQCNKNVTTEIDIRDRITPPIVPPLRGGMNDINEQKSEEISTSIFNKETLSNESSSSEIRNANLVTDEEISKYFANTWDIYPRKVSKVQAQSTYTHKLLGLERTEAHTVAGKIYLMLKKQLQMFAAENGGQGRAIDKIPHLSTWLNDNIEDSPKRQRGRKC